VVGTWLSGCHDRTGTASGRFHRASALGGIAGWVIAWSVGTGDAAVPADRLAARAVALVYGAAHVLVV
jgi:hypothetical protein